MVVPFWTPITPLTGSLLHADPQAAANSNPTAALTGCLPFARTQARGFIYPTRRHSADEYHPRASRRRPLEPATRSAHAVEPPRLKGLGRALTSKLEFSSSKRSRKRAADHEDRRRQWERPTLTKKTPSHFFPPACKPAEENGGRHQRSPMDSDTVFKIGFVRKPMTVFSPVLISATNVIPGWIWIFSPLRLGRMVLMSTSRLIR
jgi:hypothetical protein